MNRILQFSLIAIFSIFLGSQITEGCLLVPYWKTLATAEFYEYYSDWGTLIGKFYTILTVFAVLIPVTLTMYCFLKKSAAQQYSLISTFFTMLFIALFYIYFKGVNQQFQNASFDTEQLKYELEIWAFWHWIRILFEFLSLVFLILSLTRLNSTKISKTI